ncbi:MAG: HlyC/CorC family transporter [Bryobacterales bacterium]|nr:HlyC/CorC family transporter [Bryobacterales bacterium]
MVYRILLLIAILAVNAFFASAEVALVSVRRSRLRTMAADGVVGANAALNLLAHPERLLSVTQVGVTLASLGLGWAGEETLYNLIVRLFQPVLSSLSSVALHGVCFGLAFLLMSYCHVVIGEVVPKNLAIEKAERLSVLVAPVLLVFFRAVSPFVTVIERSAELLSRMLGLHGSRGSGHTAEELKFIISSSRAEGHLPEFEEDAIHHLLDLQQHSVREIMVPRNDIVSVPVTASLDHVLHLITDSLFSRLPVYEGRPENLIGYLNYKDLVREWRERRTATQRRRPVRPFNLRRYLRKPLIVPETKSVNQLIDDFRRQLTHMALVVDEYGTITGLVTLEDVMEQIFGEIEDEFDVRRTLPLAGAATLEMDGTTNIRDLDELYGLELPGDAGFETLAGYLLFRLGYIPSGGETIEDAGRRFTILRMAGNRIARVRIEKLPEPEAGPTGEHKAGQ